MHEMTRDNRLKDLRAEVKRRLADKPKLVVPMPAPRYDEAFYEGLAWLDADCEPIYVDLPVPTRRVVATVRRVTREQRPANVRLK